MIRLSISVASAVATSAEAQIRKDRSQPCDLPNQVRINGICQLVDTNDVPLDDYRRCAAWSEGMCVEDY